MSVAQIDPKVRTTIQEHIAQVRSHPRSGPAWGWLGGLLWAYDLRPQAIECLKQAERFEPSNPRWPYFQGLCLMIATPNEAIAALQRAVRLCADNPEAPRYRLARLLVEQGRYSEAQRELEPLLTSHPGFSPARLLAAQAQQAVGDIPKAIQLARACTDDARTSRAAWTLLTALHRRTGDAAASESAARQAATSEADEGVEDPFQAEISLLRSDPRGLTEQAHPLLAAGRLAEAEALIERLRREHADYPETWLLVGRLELLRKNQAKAEPALRRFLQLNSRSAQGWFQLGLLLLETSRLEEAASAFEKATLLKPDFGPAYFNRGVALGRAGHLPEAAAALRESLRHNPERLDTYVLLGDASLRLGQPEATLKLVEQAEGLSPNDPRLKALRQRATAVRTRPQ